ncbi:putative protein kinase [Leptomonas seymouri]|uniref:Protein kinase domain-containing protein n=1 Tax=Leptomonas seymouri TaxID=5684 RepID=A0A0N1I436_LEPSE|nr:putative protein kinase [Leptomonas seymouri]|eukprot:KPI85001.1 putative protein kinase [Leptomonas seymouri]
MLSLAVSPKISHPPDAPPKVLKIDPVADAVLQECRKRTLTVGCVVHRRLGEMMCAIEAAQGSQNTQQCWDNGDGDDPNPSSEREEEHLDFQLHGSTDETGSDGELSLFIPTVDTGAESSTSQSERDVVPAQNAFEYSVEHAMCNWGSNGIGFRTFVSTATTEKIEKTEYFFPCPFGRWECGTFLGKRVFIEANNTYLGRGAMAVVLGGNIVVTEVVKGEERCLARVPVAIKGIVFDARNKAVRDVLELALRFRRDVNHPGIAHVFHAGFYYPSISSLAESEKSLIYSHLTLVRSTVGSVADVLKRTGPFPMPEIQRCMAEMLATLQFIHECRWVHNDIKSHNILLFDYTSVFSNYKYQLTDFAGLMAAQTVEEVMRDVRDGLHEQLTKTPVGGTAAFMSPESCLGLGMLTSNDIWSLGITAYHMATEALPWKPLERQFPSMILNGYRCKFSLDTIFGKHPGEWKRNTVASPAFASVNAFHAASEIEKEHSGGNRLGGSSGASSGSMGSNICREKYADFGPILEEFDQSTLSMDFQDFVRQCLIENPLARPTAKQLREHPFVKGTQVGSGAENALTPLRNHFTHTEKR